MAQILSDDAKQSLVSGISSIINESINNIINDEKQGLDLLEKLYELLDLKSVISKLEDGLGQKTLEDIACLLYTSDAADE